MTDALPNHDLISKCQIFSRYTYNPQTLERADNITDAALSHFYQHYTTTVITKDQIFDYIYGILHSPEFKQRFYASLMKELPRVPLVDSYDDFISFSEIGSQLAELHLNYENLYTQHPDYLTDHGVVVEHKDIEKAQVDPYAYYRVSKMKLARRGKEKDLTKIIFNPYITLSSIPERTWDYEVGGKSALKWIMEHQLKTEDTSGITKDPNLFGWGQNQPAYLFHLLCSGCILSLKTQELVASLPALRFKSSQYTEVA